MHIKYEHIYSYADLSHSPEPKPEATIDKPATEISKAYAQLRTLQVIHSFHCMFKRSIILLSICAFKTL